ncbi:MAG: hypothetical protein J2O46_05265, partial [Nocardioides sp.]|nr:hypothetical protein [Nocardioides sp.]
AVALDAWHHALRDVDDDLGGPLTHPDDYPACLAAWLTRPATIEALGSAPMQAESLAALESFAAYMHEPAPSLLHDLAVRRQEAA